jgi:hypothetical protein
MEVLDQVGTVLSRIDVSVGNARHVVHVENISTLPRDARVAATLPNGTARIEFVDSSGATASWDNFVLRIPPGKTRDLECPLRRNSGGMAYNEPLQCDKVYDRRGTLPWRQLTAGIPFQMTIHAA